MSLQLRVYGASASLTEVGARLEDGGVAGKVVVAKAVRQGNSLLTAEVQQDSADAVLEFLMRRGVERESIALARFDELAPIGSTPASLILSDVVGQARANARPVARFLVFMATAGVIAGFGVIGSSEILIVGAMAVSPDLLPITAACVGLMSRRWRLASRALATLLLGLGTTCVTALLLTLFLDLFDLLPTGFAIGESALSGLTTVNSSTIGVALAAGIAGMLALETRASAAVGVGISITTIPAAAYLGVATAQGEADKVLGTLAVLGTNVALLLVGGTATLLIQRRLAERHRPVLP